MCLGKSYHETWLRVKTSNGAHCRFLKVFPSYRDLIKACDKSGLANKHLKYPDRAPLKEVLGRQYT